MFGLSELAIRIISGVAAVLVVFGIGYYNGHHAVQVKFDQYKAEVQAAADQQAKETAKKDQQNKQLVLETKNAYNTQLANLRAYYSLRNGKGGGTLSKVSSTAAITAGYSPDNLPPTSILAAQCAETTLMLIRLQEFNANLAKNLE